MNAACLNFMFMHYERVIQWFLVIAEYQLDKKHILHLHSHAQYL